MRRLRDEKEPREKLVEVFDKLHVGVLVVSSHKKSYIVNEVNGYVEEFEKSSRSKLVGCDLFKSIPRLFKSQMHDALDTVFQSGESRSFEEGIVTGTRKLWVRYSIFMLDSNELVVEYSDITSLMQHQKDLEIINQRLVEANEELEQFAYVASHDLREPLNKIRAFGERVQAINSSCPNYKSEMCIQPKISGYVDIMVNAATRLDGLILDLLAYSRAGRAEERPVVVNLNDVLMEVEKNLQASITATGAQIRRGALPNVWAHPVPTVQLFMNLISNALKFSKPRVVPIIDIESTTQGSFDVTIVVSDNGIGFDPKYKEEIFKVFFRLHSRFEFPGTGMGLALCRRIVRRYGGSIWATGKPDHGAKFYINLPAAGDVS